MSRYSAGPRSSVVGRRSSESIRRSRISSIVEAGPPSSRRAASLAMRIDPSGSGDEDPLAERADGGLELGGVPLLVIGHPGHLPVEAGVVERPAGAVPELLGDGDVVGVVGPVRAAQEDDGAGRPVEDADGHAKPPSHPEPVRGDGARVNAEDAGRPLAHDPAQRRLAHEVGHGALDELGRVAQGRVGGAHVAPRAVAREHVHDAHVAEHGEREARQAPEDLLVVERHPEDARRLGQQVEPSLGVLGAVQGCALGVEQPAALHRAGTETGDRGDERLAVRRDRVGMVPVEREDPEPVAVDFERHRGDRAELRGDTHRPERGPVAVDVSVRILDEHGLPGPRDVGGGERHVQREVPERSGAGLGMATPPDRAQCGLAGVDQEHGGSVGAQRGDAAGHQEVRDLGHGQRARELRGQGLEGLEPARRDATVALMQRRPPDRV